MSKSFEAIKNSRAVRRYLKNYKLTKEERFEILEAMRLTPSSYGMEPVRVLFIENLELRRDLSKAWFNQAGIEEASALIVWIGFKENYLFETHFESQLNRNVPLDFPETREKITKGSHNITNLLGIDRDNWVARQAYIMMGVALVVISDLGLNSCPTEGFDYEEAGKVLQKHSLINLENEKVIVGMFIGKHDETKQKLRDKQRKPACDFYQIIE